jgi:hypothetical protein
MHESNSHNYWWSSASFRIVHPELDPDSVTRMLGLTPSIRQFPGESKIHFGGSTSAGYWCAHERIYYPHRPDLVIRWAEEVASQNNDCLRQLLNNNHGIDVYVGIHVNVMSIGFEMPLTPHLTKLGIVVGIEFFGR